MRYVALPVAAVALLCGSAFGPQNEKHEMEKTAEKHTNRLADSLSPYLLQHVHNPVDWYPWGAEALEKAKTENKPIFLSIGYSACHWCHVMAHECFENEQVAQALNRNFVNIKVDREERPDIDEIYMQATLALNNGNGGWPMSLFLTPDRVPFWAGTYVPRDNFLQLIDRVVEVWTGNPETVGRQQDFALHEGEAAAGQADGVIASHVAPELASSGRKLQRVQARARAQAV